MRTWLYERLVTDASLVPDFGEDEVEVRTRVIPKRSEETINLGPRYLVYSLGNNTNEDLAEAPDHTAHRQFFTIWVYDEGPSFLKIDETIPKIKARLVGQGDKASAVMMVRWLETSGEFNNETYKNIFRYIRFQAIIGKTGAVTP